MAQDAPGDAAGGTTTDSGSDLVPHALLLQVFLLGVVLVGGRILNKAHVQWLGEAGFALLLGIVVSLILRSAAAGPKLKNLVSFKTDIFLYVMLPTIMFDAGFGLDPVPFMRNIGSVCALAFVGTTISTFVVGLLMWGFGMAGWCTALPLTYNLLFGALISATDPVTVLAVFSKLGANEDLCGRDGVSYINVFGESVLNDAVALVLYDTISKFVGHAATIGGIFKGIGLFVGIFLGSVALGLVVGFGAALLFRTAWFRDQSEHGGVVEAGLVVVLAFVSYLAAQAAHMSGICSIMSCAMVIRSFAVPNLSTGAHHRVHMVFGTMSALFELFAFMYIGITLFVVEEDFTIWWYAALCMVALAVSRLANVQLCAGVVNWLRLPERRMPGKQQFMLWWSGLRWVGNAQRMAVVVVVLSNVSTNTLCSAQGYIRSGAMAFALAMDAADNYGHYGGVMKTCTFLVIIATVLVNGGAAAALLEKLELKQVPLDDGLDPNALQRGSAPMPRPGEVLALLPAGQGATRNGEEGSSAPLHGQSGAFSSLHTLSCLSSLGAVSHGTYRSVTDAMVGGPAGAAATQGGVEVNERSLNAVSDKSTWESALSFVEPDGNAGSRPRARGLEVASVSSLGRVSALQRLRQFNSEHMESGLLRLSRNLTKTFSPTQTHQEQP